ncbi:MAG TPA: carotenoid oxygenase family protein [Ilumatobacteraceae bacterium]|nr:carotenoid oxygenase family protein [Ilumatobacteraceae bacterium]HRB02712.1 carotenoid oxygenase family protein [Ilumatobacteraceae bacterium]
MAMVDHETKWHLRGNWAPVLDELTETQLHVEGNIPTELQGVYLRTGPNPSTGRSDHWFFGDGMVHGVRLAGGKAEWYRNRFIETPNISDPLTNPMDGMGDLSRGTGNTSVHVHNKEILCLEEGHWPWRIDNELNTVGVQNYGGLLTCGMTAHPKICPVTGELLAFSYLNPGPEPLRYVRVGADGVLQQLESIALPKIVMMHDFNVTRNYVIFMDLPVCFDLSALASGLPFKFNRDNGARLGVMPRNGSNADIRWFEIDPCYVFHPVNAHEVGDTIVLHVSRMNEAFGSSNDDYAEVGRLTKWTVDLVAGTVSEEEIDSRAGDFGRIDDRLIGLDAKYAYLMALAGEGNSEEPVYGSSLYKYDLRGGACIEHHLGEGVRGAEPVFVPASASAGEDEGWVLSLAHDTTSDQSKLLIIDAQRFNAPPVAVIHLPRRVPYGAHGNWVPDAAVAD